MTKTEMEDAIKNCTGQLAELREILPTLATKTDLERFATKKDLERFATKKDLERFATKKDLEASELRTAIIVESLRDDIHKVAEGFAGHAVKLQKVDSMEQRLETHDVKLDAISAAVVDL